jgi:hypothetical protein
MILRTELRFASSLKLGPQLGLNIEIKSELPRMGSEANRIHLVFSLVLKPGLDHVFGEHIPLEQEIMVFLQSVERLIQRARHRFNLGRLFGLELVEVK